MGRPVASALVLGTVISFVAGCVGSPDQGTARDRAAPGAGKTTTPAAASPSHPLPASGPSTPHTGPVPQPSSASPPVPAHDHLRPGDSGQDVAVVQRRLRALGFWVGPVDGRFGPLTEQAVYALQKAAGIDRDGTVGAATRAALDAGVRPSPRSEHGHVVEVDLKRQLLMLVDGGRLDRTVNISTGTSRYYTYNGQRYLADTPRGHWKIYRQVDGWDPGPLGPLYMPKYFNRQGIAIHGYPSVPPYPASHGCVRVSLAAIEWMWRTDRLPIGTPVWVY
jgi:lipoprotein-anchoring transpeptidase ErfK/SrfK